MHMLPSESRLLLYSNSSPNPMQYAVDTVQQLFPFLFFSNSFKKRVRIASCYLLDLRNWIQEEVYHDVV